MVRILPSTIGVAYSGVPSRWKTRVCHKMSWTDLKWLLQYARPFPCWRVLLPMHVSPQTWGSCSVGGVWCSTIVSGCSRSYFNGPGPDWIYRMVLYHLSARFKACIPTHPNSNKFVFLVHVFPLGFISWFHHKREFMPNRIQWFVCKHRILPVVTTNDFGNLAPGMWRHMVPNETIP